jgi:hypothetical protein
MFRTFETFLVKAAENLSNKIFCLGLVRQEKPPGLGMQIGRPAAKKSLQARPEKPAGPAYAKPAWPGRLGTLAPEPSFRLRLWSFGH